jgi:hypothetical protein
MNPYRSEKDFLHSLRRFNALSSTKYGWHSGVSEEDHLCAFGHAIPAEQLYFKKPLDSEGENLIHVCRSCMEKLVYVTVDCDHHAREVSEHLYRQRHPPRTKVVDMMHH